MQTKVETITPTIAKYMLEKNIANRPIRWSHVEKIAKEMLDGEWQVTHQGIAFNESGFLIDGQHRLNAVILSGKPVTMAVTRDCEARAFDVIDRGVKRSLSDIIGEDRRVVEVMTLALKIFHGRQNITPSMINCLLNTRFHGLCQDFMAKFKRIRGRVTQAPIRLGAIINIMEDFNCNRVFIYNQMKALETQNYEMMTPCCQSFNRQVMERKMSSSELLSKALAVFDENKKDIQRVVFNSEIIESANQRVKNIIKNQITQ